MENAPTYVVSTASQPYELAKLTQTLTTKGNNYIIGPFRIDKISDTNGTIEGKFTNGEGEELKPTFQDASGRRFENLEVTIGKDFYIVFFLYK